MNGASLHRIAAARTQELPGAILEHPFGPEWDIYKVCGKIFLMITDKVGEEIVTVKSAPEDARVLREAYPDITPGYHMNKRHWVTVRPSGEVDEGLLRDLVTESYLLVVEQLPAARRPVNPQTFGR